MALSDIYLRFTWQAWHLVISTFVLHGKPGTWRHPPSFCVAGVVLRALGWLWWRAWTGLVAGDVAALCVAGVALGNILLRFAWQAWHFVTSTFVLCGRRGTWRHPPSFCVAGVALAHIHFRFAWLVAGVALGHIHLRFAWQAWHLSYRAGSWSPHAIFHTRHLSHTIFVTHNFHTPSLSHTIFHTASLSRTIFRTQLCHTPSFTHCLSRYSYHVVLLWSFWPKQKLQTTNLRVLAV